MTTRELLEMASLDALGLLDDEEREAFERSYRAASPGVQRQVRREQARLASDESLLPQVEPSAGLRDRVLVAVRDAMRSVVRTDGTSDVLARLVPSAVALRRNVSPLWRAACIGFATATVVLLTAGYSIQREWNNAVDRGTSGEIAQFITQKMGAEFSDVLLSPQAEQIAFVPASADATGMAKIFFMRESATAFIVLRDLPEMEGQYSLAVIDDKGQVAQTLASFAYNGALDGRSFEAPANGFATGLTLAILTPNKSRHLVSLPA
jgi:hypothetical protein